MDHALEVMVPSFCFNGFMIIHSFILWGMGAFFILYGTLVYHVLDTFFMDSFGVKTAGTIVYLSIGAGVVMVCVSFMTNFVIMYQSAKSYGALAMVYGFSMLFVLLFCIIGFFYTPHMNGVMRVGVKNIMDNYNAKSVLNIYLDGLQLQLKCCGAEDYTSWFRTTWAGGKVIVPASCCKNVKYCHNLEPLIVTDIYEKGCYKVFDNYSTVVNASYIGTIIGSIITQFIAIASAIKMALRYKKIRVVDSVLPMVE